MSLEIPYEKVLVLGATSGSMKSFLPVLAKDLGTRIKDIFPGLRLRIGNIDPPSLTPSALT